MLAANSLPVEERSPWGDCGNWRSGSFTQDCASARRSETADQRSCCSMLRLAYCRAQINTSRLSDRDQRTMKPSRAEVQAHQQGKLLLVRRLIASYGAIQQAKHCSCSRYRLSTCSRNCPVELLFGKGVSGTGTSRNLHSDSHPSPTSNTRRRSAGIAAQTSAVFLSNTAMA